ncbi:MAG: cysteine desulfurase [Bacteroidales bacterium]|nr:cysteine desulfurase [Bacteroidales bacterium]
MDIDKIREEFPILAQEVYKKPLVYLDNAATTQKPKVVIDAISNAYCTINANVHRGVHHLSQLSTEGHEGGRERVRQFINAKSTKEIIFTRGTTESINLVASSFGEAFLNEGDEVIISAMEHHSNIVPWQMLESKKGIKLRVIPITPNGELDIDAFRKLLNERTKLISVAHVSNVLGTINPIKDIVEEAHKINVPVLVDGAQGAPHIKIDVQALDVDFYVFSGHKMYAPTGIGVLYGKEKWLEAMPPYQGGGEMIAKVTFEKTTFNELPFKFEAGTPDYVGVMAMTAALDYIENVGIENIAAHETGLLQYTTSKLSEIEGITIYGNATHKSGVISFNVDGIHPYDIGMLLDKQGVAVRTGHLCAQPLMDLLGIPGVVRASFALYNTLKECDKFIVALQRAIEICR